MGRNDPTDTADVQYDERDGVETIDAATALDNYHNLAERLNAYDRVYAEVETDKSFSPNLAVHARKGYGAPSQVMAILVDEFDPDDFLAVEPVVTPQGGPEVMYRVAYGGH